MNKSNTPEKFYRADDDGMTEAATVSELISLLSELPADAPLENHAVKVTVYNISGEMSVPFVAIEAAD